MVSVPALDYAGIFTDLTDNGVIPTTFEAVYASGSTVRGWGNATSDLDIYVVSTHPYDGEFEQLIRGTLKPSHIPRRTTYVRGRRVDVEYWLDDQVEQLLWLVDEVHLENARPAAERLTIREIEFMGRLLHALPLAGEEWLARRRSAFEGSALRPIMVDWCFNLYDNAVEDAVGQLNASDLDSAVLAASRAFGCAVDALLCHHGEINLNSKWRARRMRSIDSPLIPFSEYWQLETMQGFDPSDPCMWVTSVLQACQRIAMEVPVR